MHRWNSLLLLIAINHQPASAQEAFDGRFTAPKVLEGRVSSEQASGSLLRTSQRWIPTTNRPLKRAPLFSGFIQSNKTNAPRPLPEKARKPYPLHADFATSATARQPAESLNTPVFQMPIQELEAAIHSPYIPFLDGTAVIDRNQPVLTGKTAITSPSAELQASAARPDYSIGLPAKSSPAPEIGTPVGTRSFDLQSTKTSARPHDARSDFRELTPAHRHNPEELLQTPTNIATRNLPDISIPSTRTSAELLPAQPAQNLPELSAIPNSTNRKELQSKIIPANREQPSLESVSAKKLDPQELALAQRLTPNFSSETVSARMTTPKELTAPAASRIRIPQLESGNDKVGWDQWFEKFGQLGDASLLKTLSKYSNPAGSNTVSVLVSREHQVQVSIINSRGGDFDKATLEAYLSLDGNIQLEFPKGTRLKEVSFQIDNSHDTADEVTDVKGERVTNFKEEH